MSLSTASDCNLKWRGFAEPADRFAALCDYAKTQGVKLILLTGASSDKAAFVNECLQKHPLMRVNLGLELSKCLLDVPKDDLGMAASDYLRMVGDDQPVLLENIDILFDPGMDLDVLEALKHASRSRLLCADWRGPASRLNRRLTYAPDDYLERQFPFDSEIIVLDESGYLFPEGLSKETRLT